MSVYPPTPGSDKHMGS
ncbi:hypothetical protein F383_06810 [Gossypium arboreum]|uniref:Uncharacterized protein n=1 Tax=Gossypium arboreum TaxID=29729 RepID=A0A0B0N1W4_GOSAR|nr:hypothetical protein F383_31077 [Gossypium arboreum]KHG24022.1 hypothetical protein F383_06810 [Gossypium arboreum]